MINKYLYSVFTQNSFSTPSYNELPPTSSSLHTIVYKNLSQRSLQCFNHPESHKGCGHGWHWPCNTKVLCTCSNLASLFLFTFSIKYCVLPSEWKVHCIMPILKSGDKNNVANYRPISLSMYSFKVTWVHHDKVTNCKFITYSISFSQLHENWLTLVLQQMLVFLSNIYESKKVQVDVIDILSWLCQGF